MKFWLVSTTYTAGEKLYQVYRISDESQPDHSGTREVVYTTNKREDAEAYAEVMNR